MLAKPKKKPKKSKRLTKREIEVYKVVQDLQPHCIVCGKSVGLQRHHIRFGKSRDTYIGNIATVCGPVTKEGTCHKNAHDDERYWKQKLIDMVNEIHNLDLPYHYIYKEEL
jgi:predicted transcriptional regulator